MQHKLTAAECRRLSIGFELADTASITGIPKPLYLRIEMLAKSKIIKSNCMDYRQLASSLDTKRGIATCPVSFALAVNILSYM